MATQPKSKILLLIIAILLIANIVLVAFFVLKPAPKKGGRGDRYEMIAAFLQHDIGFSKEQLQQYDTLNAHHRTKIKGMFDAIRKDKDSQFKQLTINHFSDSAIVSTAGLSVNKQNEIEVAMLRHFKDIRDLCTPQQQPAFDSLFYKVISKKNDDPKK